MVVYGAAGERRPTADADATDAPSDGPPPPSLAAAHDVDADGTTAAKDAADAVGRMEGAGGACAEALDVCVKLRFRGALDGGSLRSWAYGSLCSSARGRGALGGGVPSSV